MKMNNDIWCTQMFDLFGEKFIQSCFSLFNISELEMGEYQIKRMKYFGFVVTTPNAYDMIYDHMPEVAKTSILMQLLVKAIEELQKKYNAQYIKQNYHYLIARGKNGSLYEMLSDILKGHSMPSLFNELICKGLAQYYHEHAIKFYANDKIFM